MKRSAWQQVLAWSGFLVVVAIWLASLWIDQFSDELTTVWDRLWGTSFLAFPLVGAFLASRLPRNPVGWLFIAGSGFVGFGVGFGEMGDALNAEYLHGYSDSVFAIGLVLLSASIVVFPDGRYPNKWFAAGHLVAITALMVESLISPQTDGGRAIAANLVVALVALVYRAVRGDTTLRRQIGWPVFVSVLGVMLFLLFEGVFQIEGTVGDLIGTSLMALLIAGVPTSVAIAILRFRLYDFDRIVSRTVSYSIVVGLLAVVFAAGMLWIPTLLDLGDSSVVVAASTLAVAALFNPIRRRIQTMVDLRFNRSRYDTERVMAQFPESLRDRVDPEVVVDGWLGVVSETMQPNSVAIWLRK